MQTFLFFCLLLLAVDHSSEEDENGDRPVIRADNGELFIEAASGRNINIKTKGQDSKVYVNNIDLTLLLHGNISRYGPSQYSPNEDPSVNFYINGPGGILSRLDHLEHRPAFIGDNTSDTFLRHRVNYLSRQITSMQLQINDILFKNDCNQAPCKNGGTCQRVANGYFCQCPANWEGTNCDVDVNECRNFFGTELGCQNGATCINRQGSYECLCKPGWLGMHCTRKTHDCSGGNSEMCGHGTCVQITTGTGIMCICEQGWRQNGTDHPCIEDENECESSTGSHCSINPKVDCINLPGSFRCGVCPPGYEGDGFTCSDIDECMINNGGCSKNPHVSCHNIIGSRICGQCPAGYMGDGTVCAWRGSCSFNNGGCHPSAKCLENLAISAQFTQCVCPSGMLGDGVGISGCYIPSQNLNSTDCSTSPCGPNGQCHELENGITCICGSGYTGSFCNLNRDYCAERPCKNGGVCTTDNTTPSGYRCECTAQFSGDRCQNRVRSCGGVLDSQEGSIMYPLANTSSKYSHNSRCAWLIQTIHSKVINVTFTRFNVEQSLSCTFDFLQIHDGRSSAGQLIGRFCGTELPKGGNIISSANNLYFWFHSDPTVSRDGFSLHWTSIDPKCGGDVDATLHGTINSPGSPGNYPPNRDCNWKLTTVPGKRIQLHFFRIGLESHPNCSFDYLEIIDGARLSDTLLKKYCNTSQPAPLQSSGSEILIHFHSDAYNSGEGFQISYAPVQGIPGCGGLYTVSRGEIMSPSYNGRYMHNLLCDYKIQAPPNSKISIKITNFELERTSGCRYDYLAIYDGPTPESNLVGKFCGRTYPGTYTSSSNSLYMVFKTDQSVASGGFRLQYEMLCSETIIGDTGVLRSPGYPQSYPPNKVCEYLIVSSPGKAIRLSFQNFDLEGNTYYRCRYDNVEVRDGPNVNSSLLGQYCGRNIPSMLTSTHNHMYLKFTSDFSVSGHGFIANFSTVDVACGGIFTLRSGVISHPGEDDSHYENNQICTWIILAQPGHNVRITWTRFEIEKVSRTCWADYVEISERQNNGGNYSYGKFCGSHLPPAITSLSNELKIVFKSDDSVRQGGFSLVYTLSNNDNFCGGNYLMAHGDIYTPGWPGEYETNKDCIWTITAPAGQQILLNISTFNLESSRTCSHDDFLEIRNGPADNSPLIGIYCGNEIPKRISSHSNSLYLHFHSDAYITGRGFHIEFDGTATGCGGSLTSSSGVITSPNYPQSYSEDRECFWRIIVSVGSVVRIAFTDIDLEHSSGCYADYVEIYDGHDASSNVLGRFCSMSSQITAIISTTNQVFIKFRSDISIGGKGFSLNYFTDCQTMITGFNGAIESPDFPNNYPTNLNCSWTISVPKGNKINITFTHFDLVQRNYYIRRRPQYSLTRSHSQIYSSSFYPAYEIGRCSSDYVQIKNVTNNDSYNTTKLCGGTLPGKIWSSQNIINIKFVTGSYFTRHGFRLEWVIDGCGGILKKSFGLIRPPIARRGALGDTECEWLIVTSPGTAVQIYISELNMREYPDCSVDALEMYNGLSASSPRIMKICHKQDHPYQAVSTSNVMFVRLTSTSRHAGLDFRASFSETRSRCGGKYVGRSGTLTSPNYPQNYDVKMNCLWYIQVPINHRVRLDITDLDLYTASSNCEDFIKIYDGFDILKSNYTRKYCGNSHDPVKSFTSKRNVIAMQFNSGDNGAKGFKGNFSMTCGADIIVKSEGILKNYPSTEMHSDQNCTWKILAEKPEQKVSLTLTHMNLPTRFDNANTASRCPRDFIKIFDGNDKQGLPKGEYCGTKVPPTIVSQGNALTIQLGSYLGTVTGQFSAHYSVLDTACGGKLTSEEGTFTSPSYPNTYSLETDCEWFLKTSPGNKVSLTFETFELESSLSCNEDYVEVRETDGGGKLLGVYCGNQIPHNRTRAAQLYIKFHSDNTGTASGFIAHYAFVHGNEIIDQKSGEISSPLFPNYFHGPGEFTWRISTNSSTYISLILNQLEIDAVGSVCHNYLAIYDGYDETAPILKQLCGVLNPNDKDIRTTSNMVFIKMSLDESNARSLFFLRWMQVIKDATEQISISSSNCGSNSTMSIASNSSIEIMSPNYPKNYDDNLNCEWIYETIPGRHLKIIFTDFQLEQSEDCSMDYAQVFSGTSGTADWQAISYNLCLPSVISNSSLETSNLMKVIFHSDPYIAKTGFHGRISSICGGLLTDSSGIIEVTQLDRISSKPFTNCVWKIKVKPMRTIVINFERFQVPSNDNTCPLNFLTLRNGDSKESPILGSKSKFCGDKPDVRNLETTGNTLYVSFTIRNADLRDLNGFRLHYDEKSIDCGSSTKLDVIETWKTINSTNYPQPPLPYSDCVWTVMGPPGEVLRLDFINRFVLAPRKSGGICVEEYIEVRDGSSENSPLLGQYCGRDESGITVKTSGNAIYVKFVTQILEPNDGFMANISIDICGGTIRSPGEITSPGYPKYPNLPVGTICEWRLLGRIGSSLWINPLDISLPESEQQCGIKVVIEDSIPTYRTKFVQSTFCSNNGSIQHQEPSQSISNEIIIKFYAGKVTPGVDTSHFRGFRLNFNSTASTCGGRINSPTGFIQTPGYPNIMNARYCSWKISAPDVTRRIKLEILDLDIANADWAISIYNDLEFISRNAYISSEQLSSRVYFSSGNTMNIYLRAFTSNLRKGFKARFTSDEAAVCGGVLSGETGSVSSPSIPVNESYYCQWRYIQDIAMQNEQQIAADEEYGIDVHAGQHSNTTFFVKGNLTLSTPSIGSYCNPNNPLVRLQAAKYTNFYYNRDFCKSGEFALRIPVPGIKIITNQNKGSSLNFNIVFKVQQCGGVLKVDNNANDILNLPTAYNGSLDCAWYIMKKQGTYLNIQLEGNFAGSCSDEYIKIYGSMSMYASAIKEYCRDNLDKKSISINFRSFYIEYHSTAYRNNSSLRLKANIENTNTCGGTLTNYDRVLMTPNYPKPYLNNQECTWDISTSLSNKVSLKFVERFQVEFEADCKKDYVLVFDWIDGKFTQMAKLCGRTIPERINSTSNRMKVVFRSDSTNPGDGFKAIWEPVCGGEYRATESEQYLYSIHYPDFYPRLLDCVFHIKAPGKKVLVKFMNFDLESNYGSGCIYDNVTIAHDSYYRFQENKVFCGREIPQTQSYANGVSIRFQTDSSIQNTGFKIMFKINTCGGEIKNHTIIKSSEDGESYEDNLNCIWNITAPAHKNVVIRFTYFDLENSGECDMDYVAIYNGGEINEDERLGLLCGHLNSSVPIFISNGSSMIVQFVSDYGLGYNGFSAEIYFSYGESIGCGGEIDMNNIHSRSLQSPLIGDSRVYEKYLQCHWVVKTAVDKVIKLDFPNFHIAPCSNANQTALGLSNCTCDMVRIRDGANPTSPIIGTYCGHTTPPRLISSSNYLLIMLYTDGFTESSGFQATLTVTDSECGQRHFTAGRVVQHIKSPHYDEGFVPRGLHCTYNIGLNDYERVHIKIKSLDLSPFSTDTKRCERDRLEISSLVVHHNATVGRDFVQSSHSLFTDYSSVYFQDLQVTQDLQTFCNNVQNMDIYAYSATVRLVTDASEINGTYRGFDIEISSTEDCMRNYTGLQGRIQSSRSSTQIDCYTLIEAPENHTISLYFFELSSYMSDEDEYLDILDGASHDSHQLVRLSDSDETQAAFSTGRYMTIHRHGTDYYPVRYDLNFMATDKGSGCGGRLFGPVGVVTSPLYPNPYRATKTCEFELESLPESKLLLRFQNFDLGSRATCDQVYVELVDRSGDVRRTYCSDDRPVDFRSEDSYVKIVYHTTMNTGGPGWVAQFIGLPLV